VIENPALPGRSSVVTELQAFMDDDTKKGRMIRTARYKYIVFSHGQRPELLFDLETDPGETRNLAYQSAFRETVSEHRALLMREIEETGDSFRLPSDSSGS
jgi:choline-sulfatase/glucosamine-6-phosphate deaminase